MLTTIWDDEEQRPRWDKEVPPSDLKRWHCGTVDYIYRESFATKREAIQAILAESVDTRKHIPVHRETPQGSYWFETKDWTGEEARHQMFFVFNGSAGVDHQRLIVKGADDGRE